MASERFQRRIERLLDEADEAIGRYDWEAVRQAASPWTLTTKMHQHSWQQRNVGNPQEILDRGEPTVLVPMFVLQGAMDNQRHRSSDFPLPKICFLWPG